MYSTDHWYRYIIEGSSSIEDILCALSQEVPNMISVVFERACVFQCRHCVYQPEASSQTVSLENSLEIILEKLVTQLNDISENDYNDPPRLLHVGRMLLLWHVDVLAQLQSIRPDLEIGLIDSGTYTDHSDQFRKADLRLSWLDVSVDGTKEIHNHQRGRKDAFAVAVNGLKKARNIVKPACEGGRIAGLFTLTSLNHDCIAEVAELLFADDLVDTFGVTPMIPVRPAHKRIAVAETEMAVAWEHMQQVSSEFNSVAKQRFFFTIYSVDDLMKLATVVGKRTFTRALQNVLVNKDEVQLTFDGVVVKYVPLSTWPKEEILVDADGMIRLAYGSQYRLQDKKLSSYDVLHGNQVTSLTNLHHHLVREWWSRFGRQALQKERAALNRFA